MPNLQHFIPVEAPPRKVFDALTTQQGLRGWWTADSKAEPKVGSVAEFGFDERSLVFRMRIDELEPGKRVKWSCVGDNEEWKGTELEWTISKANGGSKLTLEHRDWRDVTEFCMSCNSTWGTLLYRLKDFIEGKNPGPMWKK